MRNATLPALILASGVVMIAAQALSAALSIVTL